MAGSNRLYQRTPDRRDEDELSGWRWYFLTGVALGLLGLAIALMLRLDETAVVATSLATAPAGAPGIEIARQVVEKKSPTPENEARTQ